MSFSGIERRDDTYRWRSTRDRNMGETESDIVVEDASGCPVMYDVVSKDMAQLEEQLMCIGTDAIQRQRQQIMERATHGTTTKSGSAGSSTASSVAAAAASFLAATSSRQSTRSSIPSLPPSDTIDRWGVLCDLYECEMSFQLAKCRLLDCWLEAYEHAIVPEQQRRLATVMLELIALRPYLDADEGNTTPMSAACCR